MIFAHGMTSLRKRNKYNIYGDLWVFREKMMKKVVHVSFSDDIGGAAIAAYRLHRKMLEHSIDSKMVVFEKKRKDSSVYSVCCGFLTYYYKFKLFVIGRNSFLKKKNGHYSNFKVGSVIRRNQIIKDSDVVYLHWINKGFLNVKDVKWLLKSGKKVIWYMHDMFPITGGCHHSFGCEEYKTDCRNCPMLRRGSLSAKKQLKTKQSLCEFENMYWVSPSKWLFFCAQASKTIDNNRLYCIPNIIDDSFFTVDQRFCRDLLQLPLNKRIVLYGADGVVNNPYKGFDSFVEMLDLYCKRAPKSVEDVVIMIFGAEHDSCLDNRIPYRVFFLGDVLDERLMNCVYNAADVMVVTSKAENYPLTVLESTVCGTPVIAFDVGGIKEIIDYYKIGRVIENEDVDSMVVAIDELFHKKENNKNEIVKIAKKQQNEIIKNHLILIGL